MRVDGLIQAAGSGTRLGLGPKAFVCLGGRTLLERAVALLCGLVEALVIAVAAEDLERATALVGGPGIRFIVGGLTRSDTTRRLIDGAAEPWLVLHDVGHPFATRGLVEALVAAARQAGAAAPGLVSTEFVYDRSGIPLHRPGDLLIGQKPIAFSRAAALAGYAASAANPGEDPSFVDVLARGGVRTAFVPGDATNIKITTAGDLRLARALCAMDS